MATQFLLGVRLLAIKFVSYLVGLEPIVVTIGRVRYVVNPKTGRMVPSLAGGAPDDGDDGDAGADDGDGAGADADADADADDGKKDDEPDWKKESRKHERRAKAAQKKADDLQRQIDEGKDKKTPDDAIEAAKKEARDAALAEAAVERNKDRLESAVTKLAVKGVKVGEDEDVKVASSAIDDAVLLIQHRIESGDIDADELFNDKGKVQTDALSEALGELLADKPHLKADTAAGGGSTTKPAGSSDAGKGKSAAAGQLKSTEGMSAEDIAKAVADGRLNDYLASHN